MTDRHTLLSLAVLRSAPAPGSPPQTGSCSPHHGALRHEEHGSYLREKHEEGQISRPLWSPDAGSLRAFHSMLISFLMFMDDWKTISGVGNNRCSDAS